MGILNVTPDSFSDGGTHASADAAIEHGLTMQSEGAAIVDIGAESTRPGAEKVSPEDELARLDPILGPLCSSLEIAVSIDTYKAPVAHRAAELGVSVINDIWGLQGDPDMAGVVADTGCALVAMHNRDSKDPDIDIMSDIMRFFETTLKIARKAGVPEGRIILDPGFGFGKTYEQNYTVLARFAELVQLGRPVLAGLSRKSMIGLALDVDTDQRLIGTVSANMLCLSGGARVLRVHDVAPHREAIKIFNEMEAAR